MERLLEILSGINPGVDWENESGLVDRSLIDSFDIITLVGDINDAFSVRIDMEHITPDNFNTTGAIHALINSLKAKGKGKAGT